MAADTWAHYFFLANLGVPLATNVAIVPYLYLVALVYLSTFAVFYLFIHRRNRGQLQKIYKPKNGYYRAGFPWFEIWIIFLVLQNPALLLWTRDYKLTNTQLLKEGFLQFLIILTNPLDLTNLKVGT